MRILIVRHGDPDYEGDCLTALGRRQAAALAEYLKDYPIRKIYASPYGRAKETASYTAERLSLPVLPLPFVREMMDVLVPSRIRDDLAAWHLPPRDLFELSKNPDYASLPPFDRTALKERMDEMSEGTRELLSEFGAVPLPEGYELSRDLSGEGDIAVFCHQGSGIAWIAHLLQIPLLTAWRIFYISTTSLTTLLLEQSEEHYGTFRVLGLGEVPHLSLAGVECRKNGLIYNTT